MTFYERLKAMVMENHKSFNQVERDLGYPRNALANYRLGKKPNATRLSELADYFDVSAEYLLGKSDDRDSKKFLKLFSQLIPENKEKTFSFLNDLVTEQASQKAQLKENRYKKVTPISFIYRGNNIWQQGMLKKDVEVPQTQIPDDYDVAIKPIGATEPAELRDGNILFIRLDDAQNEAFDFDEMGGFIFRGEKFVKYETESGRLLYINQRHPDFDRYCQKCQAHKKVFPVVETKQVYQTR